MNEIVANDRLGAFCRHTHVEMKGASHGPLLGLTFAVKDIYDVAGHRTGFGSPDWLRTHGPAAQTAPVVQRLLDAGAHLVGKTHTDELTWSLTGENAHHGAPLNVSAPGRITGGSSSGSCARSRPSIRASRGPSSSRWQRARPSPQRNFGISGHQISWSTPFTPMRA